MAGRRDVRLAGGSVPCLSWVGLWAGGGVIGEPTFFRSTRFRERVNCLLHAAQATALVDTPPASAGMDDMEEQHLRAKARIHGSWAGWSSLQYIDAEEEAAFMANDFRRSRDVTLVKKE